MPAQVVTPLETIESWEEETPIAGTEQVGHIIAVVQNSQVGLGISMELTPFRQLVYDRSNVFYSMYVSTWNIPKYREETTALRALLGNILAKPPTSSIECDQFRVPHSNDRLICNLGDPCTAGEHQTPFLGDQPLLPLQQMRWPAY